MSKPPEEHELIAAWLTGTLSEDERNQLSQRLQHDPATARRAALSVIEDAMLHRALRAGVAGANTTTGRSKPVRPAQRRHRGARNARPAAPIVVFAGLAAVAAVLLVAVVVSHQRPAADPGTNASPSVATIPDPPPRTIPAAVEATARVVAGRIQVNQQVFAPEDTIPLPAIMRAPTASRIAWDTDQVEISLEPDTELRVSLPEEARVDLQAGQVTVDADPRTDRPDLVVHTHYGTVRVVGTRFTVAQDAWSAVVSVDHGVVAVTSFAPNPTERHLTAGQEVRLGKSGFIDRVLLHRVAQETGADLVPDPGSDQPLRVAADALMNFRVDAPAEIKAFDAWVVRAGAPRRRQQAVVERSNLEAIQPFYLFGDFINGDGSIVGKQLPAGRYTLVIQPYADAKGTQSLGEIVREIIAE